VRRFDTRQTSEGLRPDNNTFINGLQSLPQALLMKYRNAPLS
jgi:hypothetical protein